MDNLTQEELDVIQSRCDAATVGPWVWEWFEKRRMENEVGELGSPAGVVCHFGVAEQYYPTEGDPPNEADSDFIASARLDVPRLLAEVRLLQATIKKLEATDGG